MNLIRSATRFSRDTSIQGINQLIMFCLNKTQELIAQDLANDLQPCDINIKHGYPANSSWARKNIQRMRDEFNVKTTHVLLLKLKLAGIIK